MRELRGYFFEQLTLSYIQNNEDNENIIAEANVHINNYISHTWDFIIKNKCTFIECKFNHSSLKRPNIDNMTSLKNKIEQSNLYFASYSQKRLIIDYLHTLKQNTNPKRYDEIIKQINIISLENYIDNNLDFKK